jgi:5'-nucleotidase/UDP-sugar diphosphatase
VSPNTDRALFCRDASPSSALSAAPRRLGLAALTVALVASLTACGDKPSQPAQPSPDSKDPAATAKDTAAPKPPEPQMVTLLITGSVSGQLVPVMEGEQAKGGAAEILGRWVAEEKHCAGPVKPDGQGACADASTLVLATGDHWHGPALSSFFVGETTSAVMARMGYAASALGNHEFDFGREQFTKNASTGGFPFLAANLKVKDAALAKGMEVPAFKVFDRKGLKVGVVGLTSPKTVTAAMAGRAEGLDLVGFEEALASAVPQARSAGADLVVVLVDGCVAELQPTLDKHPEWKLALVAGGRCPTPVETKSGDTALVSLGRGFDKYLRASVTFDPAKPAGEKVTKLETKVVDVVGGSGAPPADAETAKLITGFKEELDKRLGEQIGFTKTGLKQDSPLMGRWVAGSMREVLKTDVVVLNRKGIRQDLPAGPITLGSIYSVLPFENSLLMIKVKGADLAGQLANPEALISGFTAAGKGKFKDAKGKPLDPKKEYTVGTVEYVYFGGDGFEFEKLAPETTETGMAWQTPVVEWTRNQKSNEKKPIEKSLPK